MNQINIRNLESRDLPEIKNMVAKTWNFNRLAEQEGTLDGAMGMVVNTVLNKSSFAKVAVLNDKVVGCIFGSIEGEEPIYRRLQDDGSSDMLALLTATKQERINIIEYMTQTVHTYEQLIMDHITDYDGCLEFFAVDEEARGLKLGKKLWNELTTYFKSKNTQAIYLYTDTNCNFGFYDYNGFSRKKEQNVTFNFATHQENKTIYLYDYKLKIS